MIGYLKGNLVHAEDGVAIIEAGGVGYEVACSASAYNLLVRNGGGEVFIYTALKEDGISLYGFVSVEEKKAFLQLISVSGVGPKMGITVLSAMSVKELILKIAAGDIKGLSAVKGLGKKTAERIILELKEKMGGQPTEDGAIFEEVSAPKNPEAVTALMGLGFTRAESENAVRKAELAGAADLQQTIALEIKSMR